MSVTQQLTFYETFGREAKHNNKSWRERNELKKFPISGKLSIFALVTNNVSDYCDD